MSSQLGRAQLGRLQLGKWGTGAAAAGYPVMHTPLTGALQPVTSIASVRWPQPIVVTTTLGPGALQGGTHLGMNWTLPPNATLAAAIHFVVVNEHTWDEAPKQTYVVLGGFGIRDTWSNVGRLRYIPATWVVVGGGNFAY